jgi:hypothetical protein
MRLWDQFGGGLGDLQDISGVGRAVQSLRRLQPAG